MRCLLCTATITVGVLFLALNCALAGGGEQLVKTFEAAERLEIRTVSGDCIIKTANTDKIEIDLTYNYKPASSFEPIFRERGKRIILEEIMRGSNRGSSVWRITVPPKTEIDFESASGNFDAEGLKSRLSIETASGNITLHDIKGEINASSASGDLRLTEISGEIYVRTASGQITADNLDGRVELQAASGNIDITETRGTLKVSNASGNIDASRIAIEGESAFASASGDARIRLSESPDFDLEISSASGEARLDFGGNAINGEIEMTARLDKGTIESPVKFEKEETFTKGRQEYIRKSFVKGTESPFIQIRTASGSAVLDE
ncbi:conserved exported hypothetical protein [Candidatus Zixiibacteriota bacterium]|nr:conserved exported hypothetical protein [candidate division Zixibacteria bacterium]